METCIVIPAHNERRRIARTLERYEKELLKSQSKRIGLLVVSDGRDATDKIVARYVRRSNGKIRLIRNSKVLGKGGNLLIGFNMLCKDDSVKIVGFVDADSPVSGKEILRLIRELKIKKFDGVIASRYLRDSRWIGKPELTRVAASRFYNLLVRLLFGFAYTDTQCGVKLFRKSSLCSVLNQITLTGFCFDIDLLYVLRSRHFKVEESPVSYEWSSEKSSLAIGRQVPRMFADTVCYRILKSPVGFMFRCKRSGDFKRGTA